MRVPGIVFADPPMIEQLRLDQALEQVANVATLPGIVTASLAMPDLHWGYGFPIGGVAAIDARTGVISPGGVGYDINCGVRLIRTDIPYHEVSSDLARLLAALYASVPVGVGTGGTMRLSDRELNAALSGGARWAVSIGRGWQSDLERTEDGGMMAESDPEDVSRKARKRGFDQLGTLGSGNHFLELGRVAEVYDDRAAAAFGLFEHQLTVMIHTGSRGLGHQVCTDYLRVVESALSRYGIELPDRQLACAPIESDEGRAYLSAMGCACNFAWANRQCLTDIVRGVFASQFRQSPEALGMQVVFDQAHNMARIEQHVVNGTNRLLCVHRKGAARSLPAGRPEIPAEYRDVGQPVLVPGDMGTGSYVLAGGPEAPARSFCSSCHGAGRRLSRGAARRSIRGDDLRRSLAERGILIHSPSDAGLAEEAPDAYKDVHHVVNVTHQSGLALRVARLKPLGVIKG